MVNILHKVGIVSLITILTPFASMRLYRKTREEYIRNKAVRIHSKMMDIDQQERTIFYNKAIDDWRLTNQSPNESICRAYDTIYRS